MGAGAAWSPQFAHARRLRRTCVLATRRPFMPGTDAEVARGGAHQLGGCHTGGGRAAGHDRGQPHRHDGGERPTEGRRRRRLLARCGCAWRSRRLRVRAREGVGAEDAGATRLQGVAGCKWAARWRTDPLTSEVLLVARSGPRTALCTLSRNAAVLRAALPCPGRCSYPAWAGDRCPDRWACGAPILNVCCLWGAPG